MPTEMFIILLDLNFKVTIISNLADLIHHHYWN